MTPTSRRVDQILTDTPLAAGLLARLAAARRAARAIAPICAGIAPDLDPLLPGCCDLREKVLRIWLRSSAHATKLRQAGPRLLACLQAQGIEVSEIKVGVQLGRVRDKPTGNAVNSAEMAHMSEGSFGLKKNEMSAALAFSRKLALALPDGDLRRAASRLGSAIDGRLAGIRESNQTFDEQDGEKNNAGRQAGEQRPARP
jgi:hypothetical protein